jgi:PAS domain-containing protein
MRLKIIAGNLIAVLFLGVASYVLIRSQIQSNLGAEVDSRMDRKRELFERSWRLSTMEFVDQVREIASGPVVRQVFAGLDEKSRRRRAFEAVEGIEAWFRDPVRGRPGPPDFVAIVDETGKVLSRNKDINRMYGVSLASRLPSLQDVLMRNVARDDVWNNDDERKLFQTAIAPVFRDAGTLLGAVVVAYDISNGVAQREAAILGNDVAFVTDQKVYSSSLPLGVAEHLRTYLTDRGKSDLQNALGQDGRVSSVWQARLGDDTYSGVIGPLGRTLSQPFAYVVLANRSALQSLASPLGLLLLLTVLSAVFVIFYGIVLGTNFIQPIEDIEEGILNVINGNTSYRIEVESQELGGLAYRVNQLINVFTGVDEEDAEGRVSKPPRPADQANWSGVGDRADPSSHANHDVAESRAGTAPRGIATPPSGRPRE